MFIYTAKQGVLLPDRVRKSETLLNSIPAKYCFITGSFLFKKKYRDIDMFIISRSKKNMSAPKNCSLTILDFNDLHSLFAHSLSKSCVAKEVLPLKPLKVTLSDFWNVVNEAIPTLLNEREKYHKNVRFLILYTEFFKTGNVMDSFELSKKIESFKIVEDILEYVKREVPACFRNNAKPSYLRRFFYTWSGVYKKLLEYDAQKFLYSLSHLVTRTESGGT